MVLTESEALVARCASKNIGYDKAVPLSKANDGNPHQYRHNVLREQLPDSHDTEDQPEEIEFFLHFCSLSVERLD